MSEKSGQICSEGGGSSLGIILEHTVTRLAIVMIRHSRDGIGRVKSMDNYMTQQQQKVK